MGKVPALGLMTAAMIALAGCTGGGGGAASPSVTTATVTATVTDTATPTATAKVYSEDELRDLISGMRDADGNELKLYSREQVDQGGNLATLLMSTATVDPADCKDIATAGLLDTVENGQVAVAISEGDRPRTLSARSGREGPDAVAVLRQISGKMDQCASFSVAALGQTYQVTSQELQAETEARETFATVSTRAGAEQEMLMQVSAARGRLLVTATKAGANLGDPDRKELEDLINDVLQKAERSSGTTSPTTTGTASPTSTGTSPTTTGTSGTTGATGTATSEDTASPTATGPETIQTSPSPTVSP